MNSSSDLQTSVIIPTYNEAKNIPLIISKIYDVFTLENINGEIIVVDDSSPDGTGKIAESLADKYPVRVLIRTTDRGLAASVIDGINVSKAKTCVVMDADGSHPVEKIPEMIKPILNDSADITVGSRHTEGGEIGDWPLHRRLISKVAGMLAKGLTNMSDPTTGFMAIRRELLNGLKLSPIGWKIVLDIVVRLGPKRMIEIPITFEDRQFGQSKMSAREQWNYIRHLYHLYRYKYSSIGEFIKFCIVGGSGIFVDMGTVILLKEFLHLHTLVCAMFGFLFAVSTNYVLNRYWSFEFGRYTPLIRSYLLFVGVCSIGFLVRLITMYLLIGYGKMDSGKLYIATNFMGIIAGTLVNFFGSKFLAFSPGRIAFKVGSPGRS